MLDIVKENKQIVVSIYFTDKDGQPYTPSSVKYVIIDVITRTVIKSITEIIPSSPTVEITVASAVNAIKNDNLTYEEKLVAVEWYSGTTKMGADNFRYLVENLDLIPLSS